LKGRTQGGKIFRRIYIVTTESDEIWYGNTFRAGSYFYGISHDPIPTYGNVNGNLEFPVSRLVNQLLVYGSNYGLYTVVVGKTASSGWGCTRRRQLLTARRTGWTAIRRHIGGGAMESRTTMYSASATHLKVSKTESAQASTGTPAKFLIVSNQLTGLCLPFMNMIVIVIITGRMPRSGKLPVLFLLTGQKSGFSPRRGDTLHRFRSNFSGPTGTWVRLAVQNFTSIAPGGWECGGRNIKNFHFLVNSRPVGATPLTDFQIF